MWLRSLLLIIVLMIPSLGSAQEADEFGEFSALGDDEDLFMAIPSVFGASKYEQKVTDAPSAVSVVTAAEIAAYGYETFNEVLASLRGFYITSDDNYTYVGVRGFGRPGDYSTRVLLTIDGQHINDTIYGAVSTGNDQLVSVQDIERVEVIRGPSSSLYGNHALFAVVNVITTRGRDLEGGRISATGDTDGGFRGRASYGQRLENGFEFMVTAGAWHRLPRDRYYIEFDSPETSNGIAHDADSERAYDGGIHLSYGAYSLRSNVSWRLRVVPTAPYETIFDTTRTRTRDLRASTEFRYDDTYSNGLNVSLRAFYDHVTFEGDYLYDYAEEEDEEPYIVLNQDEAHGDWLGAEVTLTGHVHPILRLVGGTRFVQEARANQSNFDEEVYLDAEELTTNVAGYLQADLAATDWLNITAGARVDWYSHFGVAASPRAALVFKPFAGAAAKLIYGESFRAPSAYERLYHDGEETIKAPESLEPERIRMYELVWEQQISEQFRIVLDGYFYEITDLISLTTDPADDLLVFSNSDEANAYGVEAAFEWRFAGVIDGRASYAYQQAWDVATGQRLSNSPEHSIKLNVSVPVIEQYLTVSLEGQYLSALKTIDGSLTGDLGLLNLTLLSRELLPGLELTARFTNLLNQKYEQPASEEHLQRTIPQDGFGFRARVAWRF